MISDLNNLECITLFVEDLPQTKKFYETVFSVKPVYEDQDCTVVRLENVMLNLLKKSECPTLITPVKVGGRTSEARMMFTIKVPNVNDVCSQLKKISVDLLNGPQDRPWGRRTAAFGDPEGNIWEVAQEL